MTQPPLTRSKWASLWGGPKPPSDATAEPVPPPVMRPAAAPSARGPAEPTDAYGQVSALDSEDEDADGNPVRHPEHTLRAAGYGGFTVKRAVDSTGALLGVLAMCEANLAPWDPVLTRFGVLVARLDTQPKVSFFVRRTRDGMTLAVPDARSRNEALLQITQALLELQVKNRATFEKFGVTAFRNG